MESINQIIDYLNNLKEKSIANKRKVAAVIVEKIKKQNTTEYKILSDGVNFNMANCGICENINNETFDTVIHAEESAIMNFLKHGFSGNINNVSIFCTYSPCIHCARLIVQAGIKNLYFLEEHENNFRNAEEIKDSCSAYDFLSINKVNIFKYSEYKKCFEHLNINSNKSCIVYHSADSDGLLSAKLISMKFPYYDLIPYNYEENPEWLTNKKYYNYIFVDICPPKEFIKLNESILHKVTIFDHHKDRLQYFKNLTLNKIYNDEFLEIRDNVEIWQSAAYVIHNFFKKKKLPFFTKQETNEALEYLVRCVSLYDTWEFEKPNREFPEIKTETILHIQNVLKLASNYEEFSKSFDNLFFDINNGKKIINDLSKDGKIIETKNISDFNKIIDKSCIHNINGLNFVLFEGYPDYVTSEIICKKYDLNMTDYLMYISFQIDFKNELVKVSVRDRNSYQDNIKIGLTALEVAKEFKGGGHLHASGFSLSLKNLHNFLCNFESIIKEMMSPIVKQNYIDTIFFDK